MSQVIAFRVSLSFLAVHVFASPIAPIMADDGDKLPPLRPATIAFAPRADDSDRVPNKLVDAEQQGESANFHFDRVTTKVQIVPASRNNEPTR
jgi:hypothetical protein